VNISGDQSDIKYYGGVVLYVYTEGNFRNWVLEIHLWYWPRCHLIAERVDCFGYGIVIDNRDHKQPLHGHIGFEHHGGHVSGILQAPNGTPPFIDGKPVANNLSFNPMAHF
jgi:hypothetical protein